MHYTRTMVMVSINDVDLCLDRICAITAFKQIVAMNSPFSFSWF